MEQCALCREHKTLKKSHLIPKSAYRHVRDSAEEGGGSPLRVHLAEKEAFYTDKQVDKHLLCGDCEQLFSKRGEEPVSRLWATKKTFPLLERLRKSGGKILTTKKFDFYPPGIIDPAAQEALFYFGVSVIWRSNCWDWGGKSSPHKGSLGPYEERFRNYLLGHSVGVDGVKLMLTLDTNKDLQGLVSFPYHARAERIFLHRFNVLSLYFDFVVGNNSAPVYDRPFEHFGTNLLVLSKDMSESKPLRDLAAEFQKLVVKER